MLSTLSAVKKDLLQDLSHMIKTPHAKEIHTHTQQSSEGDGRRQSSEVDEDDSSNNLGV